ncbi:MAG: thiamine pyrophosphate-binding protein [Planctomycetia bacterium]|nr:thiamine pyrophosphate-binding protein [Planctomycetia bacterium]
MTTTARMPFRTVLETLRDVRTNEIVVATMGSAREWPKLSQHPLDFQYLPSAMGHAPMLALGLALARPERHVVCLNGDGCMLMGLSSLVSIVAAGAKNLTLIVFDNGLYEVTGGQPTAAAAYAAPLDREVKAGCDFVGMARAAGFPTSLQFDAAAAWKAAASEVLRMPGPRFVQLCVESVGKEYHLPPPAPIADRIAAFQAALTS